MILRCYNYTILWGIMYTPLCKIRMQKLKNVKIILSNLIKNIFFCEPCRSILFL